MSTIEINAATESAILTMLASQQERLLTTLAEKYGFEVDEARDSLPEFTSVTRKEVKPRKSKTDSVKESKVKKPEILEEKPKKAKTGYLLFCDAARSSARSKLESDAKDTGDKVLAKHVVTLLGRAWKDLDEEDQAMWKERAERIKAGEGHLLDELEVDLADADEESLE